MLLRRGIEEAIELVVAELQRESRGRSRAPSSCTSRRSPPRRTRASAASSPRRWTRVGADGVVTIEETDEPGISVRLRRGHASSRTAGSRRTWSATRTRMETVFENPLRPHDQQAAQAPERSDADPRRGRCKPAAAAGHPGARTPRRARWACSCTTTQHGTLAGRRRPRARASGTGASSISVTSPRSAAAP